MEYRLLEFGIKELSNWAKNKCCCCCFFFLIYFLLSDAVYAILGA